MNLFARFSRKGDNMLYRGRAGKVYHLKSSFFAKGGEGEIYEIVGQAEIVAKIYKNGKNTHEKELKLLAMINNSLDQETLAHIAWPRDILYSNGKFAGFIMPKFALNENLEVFYEYGPSAKYPDMPWKNRIILAENLCAILDAVHKKGHVCGDLNPRNISIDPNSGYVTFYDADSFHIKSGTSIYRCDVGKPEYLAPEIQKKLRSGINLVRLPLPTFSQETDNFALAIHIFQLLMNGVHPFACAVVSGQSSVAVPQPVDNIIKGYFPFIQKKNGIQVPVYAPQIDILPARIRTLFVRAFIDGHNNPLQRPGPVEWHDALHSLRKELKTCYNKQHHQYYARLQSCPWCSVDRRYARLVHMPAGAAASNANPVPVRAPQQKTGQPLRQQAINIGQASPPRQNTNQKPVNASQTWYQKSANASQTWYQKPVNQLQSLRQILANVNPSNAPSAYSSSRNTGILNSKWLFWILTLVLALGISLAVFLFLSPIIFEQSDSEGIIESVINFMCMCSPYCIFAGGMIGTIYYNVQITLYTKNQILPRYYLISVICCLVGNVSVGAFMFALTIVMAAVVGICMIIFTLAILAAILSGG